MKDLAFDNERDNEKAVASVVYLEKGEDLKEIRRAKPLDGRCDEVEAW